MKKLYWEKNEQTNLPHPPEQGVRAPFMNSDW